MKFIDFIMEMSVRKDEAGNDVFFPWGIFGKGHVIDNPAKKDELRKFLRSYYMGMLLIIAPWLCVIQPYLLSDDKLWTDFLIASGLIALSLVWFYFGIKPIIQNLPESMLRMKVRDNLKASGKFFHPVFIGLLGLMSLMFVVGGFCMLSAGQTIIGLAAIIFFGFCAIIYGRMLFLRFEKEVDDKTPSETQ